MKTVVKETRCGKIRGIEQEKGILSFRGIRYARAERWKYPVRTGSWEGIYDAVEFGPACIQRRTYDDEAKKDPKPFFYREFREGMSFTYSEDCQFLNIIAPAEAVNAPVILYIHGGAFMGGCGNEMHMDGTAYAERGLVFVSINYRLGVFGYLSDLQLTAESGHSGNYGLYDQLEALRWVYDNIADYGGDPHRITLFGQSAGAMSVQQLVLSPEAAPLIGGAYMASGAGIGTEFAHVGPVEDSYEYWGRLTALLGANPEEWRRRSSREVMDAFNQIVDREVMSHCCPHVDGRIIRQDPGKTLEEGKQARIPYLLSTNSEDMVPEILHGMAENWCEAVNRQKQSPAYYFRFARQLPGDDAGAFHSAELWYTIGSLKKCWRPMEEMDYRLSDALVSSIACFAGTGDPNSGALSLWKPLEEGDREMLVFDDEGISMKGRS